jgi:AAHS family 4-hydroxybenzoate transporter-like MFS transporter
MDALILFRFLTGLGLGAALPNLVAMSNEYSPRRLKALTVVLVFAGFPLGAALGGLASAQIAQEFGWRSIFVVGGVAPLIIAILMWWLLPESLQVLLRGSDPRSIELATQHLTKIVGPDVPLLAPASAETQAPKVSVLELFGEGYRVRTLMLWTVHLATLLIYYFLVGWLPTILAAAGLQIRVAILVTVLLSLGAIVGGIGLARFVDRHGSFRVLIFDYFAAGVICVLIGALNQNVAATAVLVFLAGVCVGGAQLTAYALAASLYPGRMRGTGVGWAVGSSRVGSILGPVIGGALIGSNLGMQMLFALLAIPAVLAACAVGVIVRLSRTPD